MSNVIFEEQDPPTQPASRPRACWSVDSWAAELDMCRMSVYNLMHGRLPGYPPVESVKIGKSRRIITSPAEFLASCPRV
jgi:hypothetical protein